MTKRLAAWLAGAAAIGAAISSAGAQGIAERVTALGHGTLQVRYTARPGACGDGSHYLHVGLGGGTRYDGPNGDYDRCEPGPARILATVDEGRVTRMRIYVGPDRGAPADADLGRVSTGEAARFFTRLIQEGDGSVAQSAVEALVLADSVDPWPMLLGVARSTSSPQRVARSAAFWLGQGAAARLGLEDADERTPDDEVRAQAVFALSQQPKERAVPELLTVAREARHPVARARALFWLGQTGDPRALDLFADILGIR